MLVFYCYANTTDSVLGTTLTVSGDMVALLLRVSQDGNHILVGSSAVSFEARVLLQAHMVVGRI